MKCSELQELISAYADDELSRTQSDFLEKHLERCADCRAVLKEYRATGRKLLSLRQSPQFPDITRKTMERIHGIGIPAPARHWLKPVLVGVPVAGFLITFLILNFTGFFLNTESVIARAFEETAAVTSYRALGDFMVTNTETGEIKHVEFAEWEYSAPDRFHSLIGRYGGYYSYDTIYIGNDVYTYVLHREIREEDLHGYQESVPSTEKTLEAFSLLKDIERVEDEVIDGVGCLHYRGTIDGDKYNEKMRQAREEMVLRSFPDLTGEELDRFIEPMERRWREMTVTHDIWIGKNDYLIRQWTESGLGGSYNIWPGAETSSTTIRYFDFNEEIVIEAPLDKDGNLLEDWNLTSFPEATKPSDAE